MLKRLLELLGLRKAKPKHGKGINASRSYGNMNAAIDRINQAGFRYRADKVLTFSLHKGERKISGLWCVASHWPEHKGAMIAGWYKPELRRAYTVCNPSDYNDYSDAVEQHEVAHDVEFRLRIAPPWHYEGWRRLFMNWRGGLPSHEVSHGCLYDFVEDNKKGE